MPIDLVSRFALTPIENTFSLAGKVISFATNSPDLWSRIADLAPECRKADVGKPGCSWRIVIEPEADEVLESLSLTSGYIGDEGISFVSFGRRSFLAYDEQTRKGISFVSEGLIRDPIFFANIFLPCFLSLLPEEKR
jgi:hypothetical protein